MEFVTIDENSKWLSAVQKLGDDSRHTLGFMPPQAFVDLTNYEWEGNEIFVSAQNIDRVIHEAIKVVMQWA